jgi:hypothetical protein
MENVAVFNAVGYLWKKELPAGKPQRITKRPDFEFEPNFLQMEKPCCIQPGMIRRRCYL